MAFTEFEVDEEGAVSGQGKLPRMVADCRANLKTPEALRELIQKFVLIQKTYGMALHDDARMLGPERFALRDLLDDCIELVIMMRVKYEKENTFNMNAPEMGRQVQLQVDIDRWKLTGSLGPNRNLKNNQFSAWLERMAKDRLPAVIRFFGEISKDGVLTPEELAGFGKLLDRLFFSMVIVRGEILSGEME